MHKYNELKNYPIKKVAKKIIFGKILPEKNVTEMEGKMLFFEEITNDLIGGSAVTFNVLRG